MQRRIVWSPGESDQFLVASPDALKLARWHHDDTKRRSVTQTLAIVELPGSAIRTVAWSPHPHYHDLVAAGLSSGKTLLLRLDETPPATPASSSAQHPFNSFQLNVRVQRACNATAFSPVEPNYLAVGLEKTRDHALQVFDIETAARTLDQRASRATSRPPTLKRGTNYESPSREPEMKPIFVAASSDSVNSMTFLTGASSTSPSLVAGMSGKTLRAYDLRDKSVIAGSSNPAIQITTRHVYGIISDPFNGYRFASHSDEGVVKIWDIRRPNDSLLTFSENEAYSRPDGERPRRTSGQLIGMAYSPVREGAFATMESNASAVRVWDILNGATEPEDGLSWPILFLDRKSSSFSRPPAHFTFAAPPDQRRSSHFLGAVSKEGSVEIVELADPVRATCGISNELVVAANGRLRFTSLEGHEPAETPDPRPIISRALGSTRSLHSQLTSRGRQRTNSVTLDYPSDREGESEAAVIPRDISTVQRTRTIAGYGADAERNAKLTHDALHEFWSWLNWSETRTREQPTMIDRHDFSFVGVKSIIDGFRPISEPSATPTPSQRALASSTKSIRGGGTIEVVSAALLNRREREARAAANAFNDACQQHNDKLRLRSFVRASTERLQRRRLALYSLGEEMAATEVGDIVKQCEVEGQPERAAAWALFAGQIDMAISALRHSKYEQLKILTPALAMYKSGEGRSSTAFKELCGSLSSDLENVYLRAIFAFLSSGSWRDVLDETALSMRDRLGIALRFLNDIELDSYLDTLIKDSIRAGDLEGILVTGLDQRGLSLLQNYIDRTGDVQTAALAASFVCPGRFDDVRAERWITGYRKLLDSWSLFVARARFDVARGARMRNAQARFREIGIAPVPIDLAPQRLLIRCNFCGHVAAPASLRSGPLHVRQDPPALKPRPTACLNCKKSFPRCAVCLNAIAVLSEHDTTDTPVSWCWCQKCRHGGHAGHLLDWFKLNQRCPVATCDCNCQLKG